MTLFFITGYVYKQIDDRTFEVTVYHNSRDWTIKCDLSDELFNKNIRPLVADWVVLRFDSEIKDISIIQVI